MENKQLGVQADMTIDSPGLEIERQDFMNTDRDERLL